MQAELTEQLGYAPYEAKGLLFDYPAEIPALDLHHQPDRERQSATARSATRLTERPFSSMH